MYGIHRTTVAVRILSILPILVTFCVLCGEALAAEVPEAGGVRTEFAPADRSRGDAVRPVIARARVDIEKVLGLSAPEKVTVRLLRTREAFLGVSDGRPVELYAGRAYPASGTIHVNMNALDRDARIDAFVRTVRHEFVHLAVGHTLGRGGELPRWFEEGLACFFGSPLPRPEAAILHRGRAFRLKALSTFPRERRSLSLAYAQADSVMRFLVKKRSSGAVRDLLRRMGPGPPARKGDATREGDDPSRGARFEDALLAATGYTVDSLDADWRTSLRPWWGWWIVKLVLSPGAIFLWLAAFVVLGFFVVKRRRRREAEMLDAYP